MNNENNIMNNIILKSDSYKASHYLQFPENTTEMFYYIESRKQNIELKFFGLQYILKKFFTTPITMEDINVAEAIITLHGEPFNRKGWEYIVKQHNGYLPIKIKSFKEGEIIPSQVPMITIETTDPNVEWIVGYIETILLRIWYPITVATISRNIKIILNEYAKISSDFPEGVDFKLHDFGARGASSDETAGIGGMSHLINFKGTDTMIGLVYAKVFYNATGVAGYSIPAAEHSSIISWGKKNESKAYKNMINKFLKKDSIVAVVSDSYDLFHAIEFIWGEELKQDIINSEGLLVIRHDSGNPLKIVMKSLNLLNQKFGSKINNKGYKVLNNVRIIQGDGVDDNIIKEILMAMKKEKYSIDNIAFGMGVALLQKMDRDTFNFAMKNSYVKVNGKGIDVFKNPITDSGKRSKKGRITTVKKDNKYKCILLSQLKNYLNKGWTESLDEIFYNGKILKIYNFEDI